MKKILLDTNSCSALFGGKDKKLKDVLKEAEIVFVSPIVIGELLTGFRAGSRERKNRKILEDFLTDQAVETLDITRETAEIYSQIKAFLRAKGKPIPTNDIWIAAQAIETGSILVSFDRHFSNIVGLRLWESN